MEISKTMNDAINQQVNRELFSAYLYLAMGAYFDAQNLSGFATWMKLQAKEEQEHAQRFYDYVYSRGGQITYKEIETPQSEWKSPLDVFKDVLNHEQKVTEMINNLLVIARNEKDYATESMLKWFIDEQVEEEESAMNVIQKLEEIGANKIGIMMMDGKLGARGSH